ncbi:hypothetical protein V6Z12_D04G062400 [Gossypium hirsutum]
MELSSHFPIPQTCLRASTPKSTVHIGEYSQSYGMPTISNGFKITRPKYLKSNTYHLPIICALSLHIRIFSKTLSLKFNIYIHYTHLHFHNGYHNHISHVIASQFT